MEHLNYKMLPEAQSSNALFCANSKTHMLYIKFTMMKTDWN